MLITNEIKTVGNKMQSWSMNIYDMLPNLAVALIVVVLFFIIAKITKKILVKVLSRFSNSKAVNQLMGNILSLTVVISGMVIALGVLNLDKTVTSLLAGAGIIGLAIGLSFQDIITNIIAGIIIAIRKPFSIGDTIETNGYQGEVRDIKLRTTEIDNFNGQVIILPSKDIFQKPLINFSALGKQRVILNAALQPSEDLERAKAVAIEAIRTLPYLMADKNIDFLYKEIAETSIKFMVRYWIVPTKTLDSIIALSDGIEALKKAFEQNNIKMPPSIAKVEITDRKTVDK